MKNITVNIIRLLLFVLFVYAGISKLADYTEFTFQLGRSPYIQHFAGITAWALPLGELVIAWMLVFNRSVLPGLYASFFLMALFTGYIYAMLHYTYFIPCSCGGILSKMGWTAHLYFNIGFTLLALLGLVLYKKNPDIKQGNSKTFHETSIT